MEVRAPARELTSPIGAAKRGPNRILRMQGVIMSDPRQHIMPVYRPPEQVFEKGEGPYLFTEDGTRYLDFIAGIAVNALGHSHHHPQRPDPHR